MKSPILNLVIEVRKLYAPAARFGGAGQDFQSHSAGEPYILRNGAYDLTLKSGSGELRSEVLPGLVIPVKAVFFAEDNLTALKGLVSQPTLPRSSPTP